jgi:hypothetical protein
MQDIAGAMDQQIRAVSAGASTDILEASEDSIIIAVHIPAAQAEEQRHQLVRLMRGEVDIHRLSYTLKGTAPSAETQAQWLAIFQAASLEAHTQ